MKRNVLLSGCILCCLLAVCSPVKRSRDQIRNVIVLIPDGCGIAHMTVARWFKGRPLAHDSMDVGLVRTWCANSMITGSAASATAFSTGHKTIESADIARALGMVPDSHFVPAPQELPPGQHWRPAATVLEAAKAAGKAVGLIATSRITHATPAAYASHWHSRYNDNIIMKQMVYQNIPVVFGGGMRYLVDSAASVPGFPSSTGKREDGENLHDILLEKGYTLISTARELEKLDSAARKVWGAFAANHMKHDIDRKEFGPEEPSLEQMTGAAIEILSKDPDGFFLVVEGSQVDWSSHDNDPVGVVSDYLAFDKAVETALDFARKDRRTAVMVFPDHDNGGMSLGWHKLDYDYFTPDSMTGVIQKARLTAAGVSNILMKNIDRFNPDISAIKKIVSEHFGLADISNRELLEIAAEFADTLKRDYEGNLRLDSLGNPVVDTNNINLRRIIGPLLSKRAGIGWTTYGHTGNDVPLFSFGLPGPVHTIDNTEIASLCAGALNVNLDSASSHLFCDAGELFDGLDISIDTLDVHAGRGAIAVTGTGRNAVFPFFTNICISGKDTVEFDGLALYSLKADKAFLPRDAVRAFNELAMH
ncbi:MAG: alkaline phosphatase [Chitinivibrionales bacterium]|nr:alkaline phosphatase [Chitinivibrionales bacterium]